MNETTRVPAQDVVVGDFLSIGNSFEKVTAIEYTDDQVQITTGDELTSRFPYEKLIEILDDEPADMEKFHSHRSRSDMDSF